MEDMPNLYINVYKAYRDNIYSSIITEFGEKLAVEQFAESASSDFIQCKGITISIG
jgi:hypothetical protein